MRRTPAVLVLTLMVAAPLGAQQPHDHANHRDGHAPMATCPRGADSGFAAVQERGRAAMGVDQYTSTHRFDALPDGGRIELQRDKDDPEGVAVIRRHLRDIAEAFARGDFSTPGFVHAGEVPGTKVMAARKGAIRYEVRDLPRGAELRLTTAEPEVVAAIAEFMAFQRMDHRAGGMGEQHGQRPTSKDPKCPEHHR